jgi:hypothetical protein
MDLPSLVLDLLILSGPYLLFRMVIEKVRI